MFHYYSPPFEYSLTVHSQHIGYIRSDITTVTGLITGVGKALSFPPYFGKNFDAFWDCVRNLEIEEYCILLIHNDLPRVPPDDLLTYIGMLRDATLYWETYAAEHRFEVWFPNSARARINALLQQLPLAEENDYGAIE